MCFDTADVYVAMEKDTEASACVQEAHLIFPFSPDLLFQVRVLLACCQCTNRWMTVKMLVQLPLEKR